MGWKYDSDEFTCIQMKKNVLWDKTSLKITDIFYIGNLWANRRINTLDQLVTNQIFKPFEILKEDGSNLLIFFKSIFSLWFIFFFFFASFLSICIV